MTGAARPMPRGEAAALLDVAEDAAPPDVQRAFLRAARRAHPDALPDASEAERRAGAEAFDRLLRARDVLLTPAPRGSDGAAFAPQPGDPDGPMLRRVPGRGLGGSLVILALLAFLLVAIMTAQEGLRSDPFTTPPAATATP